MDDERRNALTLTQMARLLDCWRSPSMIPASDSAHHL